MINKKYKKGFTRRNAGFTLVETLGAVLLLSIALVGPMVIAEKGLQTALISKDQNTAFNLAQDAVEFIRFTRDTNCLAAGHAGIIPCPPTGTPNWISGDGTGSTINLNPCITTDGSNACIVDSIAASAPVSCGAALCATPINYDSGNNYFITAATNGTTINPSIFTRSVNIKYDPACSGTCNQSEADITVTVSWSDPVAHSVVVNESIYDWQ
jgi:type II secretory pathway pseudopilin PulG